MKISAQYAGLAYALHQAMRAYVDCDDICYVTPDNPVLEPVTIDRVPVIVFDAEAIDALRREMSYEMGTAALDDLPSELWTVYPSGQFTSWLFIRKTESNIDIHLFWYIQGSTGYDPDAGWTVLPGTFKMPLPYGGRIDFWCLDDVPSGQQETVDFGKSSIVLVLVAAYFLKRPRVKQYVPVCNHLSAVNARRARLNQSALPPVEHVSLSGLQNVYVAPVANPIPGAGGWHQRLHTRRGHTRKYANGRTVDIAPYQAGRALHKQQPITMVKP